ncbi:Arylsulfotransferase (ASST) [Teratosphaeria destructans]|uniref:Arylsulfotransferase (ASST) n=1 Tax=Teratosphaeria destructans TaxID=418781 RepID=A0A9W7W378_9PEZI|nr:Arylsulfotransferase (ASST) [Teratosphaeria destructans]
MRPKANPTYATLSTTASWPTRLCHLGRSTGLTLLSAAALWLLGRFVIVPLLVLLCPDLDIWFYSTAVYGLYPERSYVSSDLTSPDVHMVRWDPVCEASGFTLLAMDGPSIDKLGPMVLDARGDLVWTSDQYGHAANLKVQTYQGQNYLTFWAGEKLEESGQGQYYMVDSSYNLFKTVSAVGQDLYGDLHEFKVTGNGTALITIYDRTHVDLGPTAMFDTVDGDGLIVDGIFQELDISTNELLFEWRASQHFDSTYFHHSYGSKVNGETAFDYFHINSVDKDSKGNYLVSLRHLYMLVYIDGRTGVILWAVGGNAEDFEDVSDGAATDFEWQHDARWVDEQTGLISLFDNGIARHHYEDAECSEGRLIKLDLEHRTAELIRSYRSLHDISSASQGSVQMLPAEIAGADPRVFVGWGSSAAYSEFSFDGTLLCETHFAPSISFYFERAKSYRAIKAQEWVALPESWDPVAKMKGNGIFVSWNGATVVAFWVLQAAVAASNGDADKEELVLEDVLKVEKRGFETRIQIPRHHGLRKLYRVAALDADGKVLRYTNVMVSHTALQGWLSAWPYVLFGVLVGLGLVALLHKYGRHLRDPFCTAGRSRIHYSRIDA